MQINIRVIPKAKLNKIVGGDPMKIYTTTAPTDGKANDAVIKQLAAHLGIAKSRVKIIRGETSRDKVFSIE
jgi:uncharacterized protein (TIGR00251 family)